MTSRHPGRCRCPSAANQESPEQSSSLDRPRHGLLHTATVALATPLPASNELHPPRRCSPLFDARRATDAGSLRSSDNRLRRWARAPPIVVRRPPSADRGPLPAQGRSPSPVHLRPLSGRHFAPRGTNTVVHNALSQIVERPALCADRGPSRAGADRRAPRANRRPTLARRRSSSAVRSLALHPTLIDD